MKKVLEPILEKPNLRQLIDVLNEYWASEQRLREEFYEKIQPGDKWEFINGKTIMHSPAKDKHTDARQRLSYLLQTFVGLKNFGIIRDETALVALTRNDYLPDIAFFSKEKSASFKPDTWKYPIPDFIVEILSEGTKRTDRGIKKDDYAEHGAKEYWITDPDTQTVEQYLLDEEAKAFNLFAKKTLKDRIESQTIQGFDIPVAAIFDENRKLEVLREWLK